MGPFLVNIAPSMFHVTSPFLISSTPLNSSEFEMNLYFCSNVFGNFILIHKNLCSLTPFSMRLL